MTNTVTEFFSRKVKRTIALSRVRSDERLREVQVNLVKDGKEALAAARIVHDAYVGRGIIGAHPTGVHVSDQSASPASWCVLATYEGRPVGTISLVVDSATGLPMQRIYDAEIGQVRAEGSLLGEIGAFAIVPEFRNSGVLFLITRHIWRVALHLGVERLAIAVHPDSEHFYRDIFLFRRIGSERVYPGLNESARAVALATDPKVIERDWPQIFHFIAGSIPASNDLPRDATDSSYSRILARKALMRARPDVIAHRASLATITEELEVA